MEASLNDIKWMRLAINEAKKAQKLDEVPVGAVLIDADNKIIAKSYNKREKDKSSLSHAEINVIKKANKKLESWRLENTTLYVTLEPCLMCLGAIFQSRIKRVVFGAFDFKGGMVFSHLNAPSIKGINHKVEFVGGVLKEECGLMLSLYFKEKRLVK